jgi:hypothetical protein
MSIRDKMVNALNPLAHAGTRAIQEGRASTMRRMGNWAKASPIASSAIAGGVLGGGYGAMSDNTSFIGGALGGAAMGAGGRWGWRNRGGFTGALQGLTSGSRRSVGEVANDVKRGWSAGLMGAYSDKYGAKAAQSRFARLNRG